jgi:predicted 3-demethylubiquinone-9 3-methyltransferase (glyoxalase superfamily)
VIFGGGSEIGQKITPALMFVGKVCGKTEQTLNFYVEVFKNSPAGMKGARTRIRFHDMERARNRTEKAR